MKKEPDRCGVDQNLINWIKENLIPISTMSATLFPSHLRKWLREHEIGTYTNEEIYQAMEHLGFKKCRNLHCISKKSPFFKCSKCGKRGEVYYSEEKSVRVLCIRCYLEEDSHGKGTRTLPCMQQHR